MTHTTTRKTIIALCTALACTGAAFAQTLSKAEYKAQEEKIEASYKAAKDACKTQAGQANKVCVEQAKGQEKNAKAELEVAYKPSADTRYKARLTAADAAYDLARVHCNEKTSNDKDVCVKEAKAAQVTAKADAKVQLKSVDANAVANEKKADARSTATDDKNAAQYKVALEKCDALAGMTKTQCQDEAKRTYGK